MLPLLVLNFRKKIYICKLDKYISGTYVREKNVKSKMKAELMDVLYKFKLFFVIIISLV